MPSSRLARFAGQFGALALTTLAVIIIATAVLVGVGRALLPHADELRPWLERQLSARLGQNVALERVEAQWPRLTPSLTLFGLQLGDQQQQGLEIDAARLEFHLPNLLDPDANLTRLVVLGVEVLLAQDEQGRWGAELAAGLAIRGTLPESWLPGVDAVIRDARLRIRPASGPELALLLPEGGLRRSGDQTLLYGSVQSDSAGSEESGVRLRLYHPDGQWRRAEGWLGLDDQALIDWLPGLDPSSELASARLRLDSWLEWSAFEDRLRLDLDFAVRHNATAEPLEGQAMVVRQDRQVQAQIDRLTHAGSPVAQGLALARRDRHWAMAIDRMDLGGLHAALDPWLASLSEWPTAASGAVSDLMLGLDRSGSVHAAAGRVEQLSLALSDPLPSFDGLDLRFDRLDDRFVLAPSGQPVLRWPHLLRAAVAFDEIGGRVVVSPDSVELRALRIDSSVAAASADGWIYLEHPRPFLDLFIRADRVGPVDPRPYLPHRIIPPPAMRWLDQALVGVEHASGYVNLHMRAGTRTRDLNPGSYQAQIEYRGLDLDYWPDWPSARDLQGQVNFIGRRLWGRVGQGRLGAVGIRAPEAEIADLVTPTLRLRLASDQTQADALATMLADIPVAGWQRVLEPMRWSGPMEVEADLRLPFRAMRDWTIDGTARLDGAALALPAIDLAMPALAANLSFDQNGIQPGQIRAELRGQPVELAVAAGFAKPAWLEVSGILNPAALLPQTSVPGALARRMAGQSQWRYRLEGQMDKGVRMTLDGDLEGLALGWPEPLNKSASAVWPFSAELLAVDDRLDLDFRLNRLLQGRFSTAKDHRSIALALGETPLSLPALPGVTVAGAVDVLALDEWVSVLELPGQPTVSTWPPRLTVDLQADRVELPDMSLSKVRLALGREASDWQVELDSAELAGTMTVPIPMDAGRAIVVDLARAHLPADQEQSPAGPASDFSPRRLPPLSMVVEDLRRGVLELGRLRLEAHPGADGLEVELLDISGPDLRLQGNGRWVENEAGPRSEFVGRISTPSLSALLRSARYDPGIEASQAQVEMNVQWPGAPTDFSLRRLLGQLDLSISEGQIPEARPGAGRLLGLVSFNAIPRRLMLDFRDVFSPGMRFDQIEGTFELADGQARTEGLVLRSPAAVMTISGQTDMVAREYDQMLRVEPGLGASLPVIGGLAGGPVGAAAGLVLRELFDGPLSGVTEVRYRITGPWESPQIELVDARGVDRAESDLPPAQD